MQNIKRLGKKQKDLKAFAEKYCNEWHGYSTDYSTKRLVASMVKRGIIAINEYSQFIATKCFSLTQTTKIRCNK